MLPDDEAPEPPDDPNVIIQILEEIENRRSLAVGATRYMPGLRAGYAS